MTHTTKNTSSITSYRTTSSSPNTFASATNPTNQKAERTKPNTKQTISLSQKKRVNKLPLIALTTQRYHVPARQFQNPKINLKITMDIRTFDHIAATDSSAETTELIQRWKDIVKPGIYRLTGGRIEERLQQIMRGREQGDL